MGGVMEYRLPDGARVDCLTAEYAVEVDFGRKWAEAIGQSIYYAAMTGRKPGILLIVDEKGKKYAERIGKSFIYVGKNIRIWITLKIPDPSE